MVQQKVNTLFNNTLMNGILTGINYNILIYKNSTNQEIRIIIKWNDDNRNFIASYDTVEDLNLDSFSVHESHNDILPGIDIITPSGARYPVSFENIIEWAKAIDFINKDIREFQSKELDDLIRKSWN